MTDWFAMEGYALYVWGAYGGSAVVLVGAVVLRAIHKKNIKQKLKQYLMSDVL